LSKNGGERNMDAHTGEELNNDGLLKQQCRKGSVANIVRSDGCPASSTNAMFISSGDAEYHLDETILQAISPFSNQQI
jgi:hypothetical protein